MREGTCYRRERKKGESSEGGEKGSETEKGKKERERGEELVVV